MKNVEGESSNARPMVESSCPPNQLALQTQEVSTPKEGKECKDLADYPFRQEMEDLVKTPLKITQGESVEEGEIIPCSLPSTLISPDNKMVERQKSQGCDT